MGILLKLLKCGSLEETFPSVYVDFEVDHPSAIEKEVYDHAFPSIQKIDTCIEMLQNYGGAADYIRNAIAKPNNAEVQEEAMNALRPQIVKLKHFNDFCEEISNVFGTLLKILSENTNLVETIDARPAIAKIFAQIVVFSFRFDEMKMHNPALQNDLSFYRRAISQGKFKDEEDTLPVQRDQANKLSMFFASPTPFLASLTQVIPKIFPSTQPSANKIATDCLASIIKVCRYMLDNPESASRFKSDETKQFVLRFMVGLIILFDHLNESGAFVKGCAFDIKQCIKVIKDGPRAEDTPGLLNAIKYTCKHLNDPTTPNSIREMLEC